MAALPPHRPHLLRFFNDWKEAVVSTVPAERLLVWQVKQGWGPLCQVRPTILWLCTSILVPGSTGA